MSDVLNIYNPDGVDRGALEGTGSGGILSAGYLRDGPLSSHLDDGEQAIFALSNARKGVFYERDDGDRERQFAPGNGYRAFALVTDARLVFVIGDIRGGENGDHAVPIPLADVERVDREGGVLADRLVVRTVGGVRWRFPCRRDLEPVHEYLAAASSAWATVERCLERARNRLVDADDSLEARAYEDAMAALDDAADRLDEARAQERAFCEGGVAPMDDRIERTAARVATVRRRALVARASHRINVAERRWRDEEYDAAYDAYTRARDDYETALATGDPSEEEAADLRKKRARVERNLSALEDAPLRRADHARQRGDDAVSPADAVDAYETALRNYRTALELDWGRSEKRFECDTDRVRGEIDAVADDLVTARRELAVEHLEVADQHTWTGRTDRARDRLRKARAELDAALSLARELVPDAVDDLEDMRSTVSGRLADLSDAIDSPADPNSGTRRVFSPSG